MPERPVLLFDVMDTLVYDPFNAEIPAFFGLTQAALLKQKHPTAWIEFELGEIDEAEYLRRYFADQRKFDHAGFSRTVGEAYRLMDGAEELLEHLYHLGFEMHALSNYPVWYRTIEARFCLSRYLRWTFVSCLTGIRKPASAAYLSAAQTLGRRPESCLFIDDRSENCQAAEAIGMPAIHAVDVKALWSELRKRRLVPQGAGRDFPRLPRSLRVARESPSKQWEELT